MTILNKDFDFKYIRQAVLCIGVGTAIGLVVYEIFLFFKIDIFGWNLGLIFAPLIAGYVETILANEIIGENLGAISAFILFIDTTFYSFILKNPTLGFNIITAGSIIVILQAAFPTLINYILLVVIGGILSNFIKHFKKFINTMILSIKHKNIFKPNSDEVEIKTNIVPYFDEIESNEKLNSLNFYFITSTDIKDKTYNNLGIYQSQIIIEKDNKLINSNPERTEQQHLKNIKKGKDECLIKLAHEIKENGGNGILNLSMNYSVIGFNGDNIQITATGMGIKIK